MSIDRIIGTTAAGPLVAGLSWRPPTGGKPSRATLVEAASLTESTHYVQVGAGRSAMYGLWQFRPAEEGERLPRGSLSAAAAFALKVGATAPDGALALKVPGREGRADRWCVVLLEDGMPSIDVLGTDIDALRLVREVPRPTWASDLSMAPGAQQADLAWLAEPDSGGKSIKAARIQAVPTNPWPAVGISAALAIAMVSWWGWGKHRDQVEQRRMLEAAAAADPTPRYAAALAVQRPTMSADRRQMQSVLQGLFGLPVWVPGWQLQAVECQAATQTCTASWIRRGGGFNELKEALPRQQLVIDAESLNQLDAALTSWPVNVKRAAIDATPPTLEQATLQSGPLWQAWKTAEFQVSLKPAALWPAVPGAPSNLVLPHGLRRGDISVTAVPAALAEEALLGAPAWVSWESLRLDVGSLTTAMNRSQLQISLIGHYYVSTQ